MEQRMERGKHSKEKILTEFREHLNKLSHLLHGTTTADEFKTSCTGSPEKERLNKLESEVYMEVQQKCDAFMQEGHRRQDPRGGASQVEKLKRRKSIVTFQQSSTSGGWKRNTSVGCSPTQTSVPHFPYGVHSVNMNGNGNGNISSQSRNQLSQGKTEGRSQRSQRAAPLQAIHAYSAPNTRILNLAKNRRIMREYLPRSNNKLPQYLQKLDKIIDQTNTTNNMNTNITRNRSYSLAGGSHSKTTQNQQAPRGNTPWSQMQTMHVKEEFITNYLLRKHGEKSSPRELSIKRVKAKPKWELALETVANIARKRDDLIPKISEATKRIKIVIPTLNK